MQRKRLNKKVATVKHRMQLYKWEALVLLTDCFCKAYSATPFKLLQMPAAAFVPTAYRMLRQR